MENDKKAYTHSFARIYDDIMNKVPYNFWYNYLNEILDFYGINVDEILDLACGTGNMSIRFARDNKQVVGVDLSEEMLDVAREKADNENLNVDFVHSDLRDLNLSGSFDLAFSVFDSLNYILTLEDLHKVFKNVYKLLNKDGILIFDLNTLKRLMSIKPGTTMFTGDDYTCFWQDIIQNKEKKWQVKLKIYFDDNARYYEELHEETSYSLNKVKNKLIETGFKYVQIYSAYTFEKGSEEDNRVYFVALKETFTDQNKNLFTNFKYKYKWKLKKLLYLKSIR